MKKIRAIAALATIALVLSLTGCSSGSESGKGSKTIEWWHIQTGDVSKGIWKKLADEFEAKHPGVKIKITVQDGTPFKTALDARVQAGDPPDIFQTWGGGGLKNYVKAGAVKDITQDTDSWIGGLSEGPVQTLTVDGKRYGVPYNAGLVGFWYNKSLFAAAGIDAPPSTWPEFLDDIAALKKSGVIPIALAAGDKYPAMFYWAELALRIGGQDKLTEEGDAGKFDSPMFVEAGEKIQELLKAEPFQKGFLAAPFAEPGGEASLVANGQAAMELMGQWAPASQVTVAKNGKGLGNDLGWFPFPTVPGGAGASTQGFGGVDGFAVGKNAPPEAIEFLKFISSVDSQRKLGAGGELLPVATGAEDSVKDPNMQVILKALADSTSVQNYLDQSYAPAVATAINDSVLQIFAGKKSPEDAASAIAKVADQQ